METATHPNGQAAGMKSNKEQKGHNAKDARMPILSHPLKKSPWCMVCGNILKEGDNRCPHMFLSCMQIGQRPSYWIFLCEAVMKSYKIDDLPSKAICCKCCLQLEEVCKLDEVRQNVAKKFNSTLDMAKSGKLAEFWSNSTEDWSIKDGPKVIEKSDLGIQIVEAKSIADEEPKDPKVVDSLPCNVRVMDAKSINFLPSEPPSMVSFSPAPGNMTTYSLASQAALRPTSGNIQPQPIGSVVQPLPKGAMLDSIKNVLPSKPPNLVSFISSAGGTVTAYLLTPKPVLPPSSVNATPQPLGPVVVQPPSNSAMLKSVVNFLPTSVPNTVTTSSLPQQPAPPTLQIIMPEPIPPTSGIIQPQPIEPVVQPLPNVAMLESSNNCLPTSVPKTVTASVLPPQTAPPIHKRTRPKGVVRFQIYPPKVLASGMKASNRPTLMSVPKVPDRPAIKKRIITVFPKIISESSSKHIFPKNILRQRQEMLARKEQEILNKALKNRNVAKEIEIDANTPRAAGERVKVASHCQQRRCNSPVDKMPEIKTESVDAESENCESYELPGLVFGAEIQKNGRKSEPAARTTSDKNGSTGIILPVPPKKVSFQSKTPLSEGAKSVAENERGQPMDSLNQDSCSMDSEITTGRPHYNPINEAKRGQSRPQNDEIICLIEDSETEEGESSDADRLRVDPIKSPIMTKRGRGRPCKEFDFNLLAIPTILVKRKPGQPYKIVQKSLQSRRRLYKKTGSQRPAASFNKIPVRLVSAAGEGAGMLHSLGNNDSAESPSRRRKKDLKRLDLQSFLKSVTDDKSPSKLDGLDVPPKRSAFTKASRRLKIISHYDKGSFFLMHDALKKSVLDQEALEAESNNEPEPKVPKLRDCKIVLSDIMHGKSSSKMKNLKMTSLCQAKAVFLPL